MISYCIQLLISVQVVIVYVNDYFVYLFFNPFNMTGVEFFKAFPIVYQNIKLIFIGIHNK